MNILALNGSPRGKNGNTEVILEPFLKGCEKAGAAIETVYLAEKNIKHCSGCFSCWTKTPGKCVHQDDMEDLLVKVSEADIMVYATPLYYFTVTGIMKDFMDRMLPLNNKEIVKVGEKYGHPKRVEREIPVKSVLISNCGFPGDYNFSGLLETFKVMTKGNLAGAILCTQGGILQMIHSNAMLEKLYSPFFLALETAGKEIVNQGTITDATQNILNKDFIDSETYMNAANGENRKGEL